MPAAPISDLREQTLLRATRAFLAGASTSELASLAGIPRAILLSEFSAHGIDLLATGSPRQRLAGLPQICDAWGLSRAHTFAWLLDQPQPLASLLDPLALEAFFFPTPPRAL